MYDATEPGSKLAEWKYVAEVTGETAIDPQRVSTFSGVELSVSARIGKASGKRVPAHIEVTLEENPPSAQVTVTCRPPLHFDGDPLDLLSTDCMISELTGTQSLLGSKESNQDTSTLRVQGDGSISVN